MRKVFKSIPFYKVFVLLFVSLYTFLPSVQALGIVVEDYANEEDTAVETEVAILEEDIEVDNSEDILDEGISDPTHIANPELEEENEEEADEPLFVYEDGVYTVFTVIEGEEYVYPGNENVRIKFTSVTEDGDLVISRVTLTEQQKEELNTTDDYGWSITSSMSNGSFTYDLTLPNNTESNDVEVKYTEDRESYKSIDNNLIVNENVIEIKGLDHFTMFVVVIDDGDTDYSDNGWSNHASGYNGDHKWTTPSHSGYTATWTFTGDDGVYAILPSWVVWDDHATNAHYTSSIGFELSDVDQSTTANGSVTSTTNGTWSGWYPNGGRYTLTSGDSVNLTVEGTTNGNLSADAMAFVNMAEIYVDDDWSTKLAGEDLGGEKIFGINAFATIQEGVDAVAPGGTVTVAAGTYVEAVEISTANVTLQSIDGFEETMIENPNIGSETQGIGVIADMGTVVVEGFTVRNFRNGIVQGMSQSGGTSFIIKHNKIIPENNDSDPYLRNGIQVSGDGSQVIGNYVVGAPLTSTWASSAIGVVNASNVLVQGNTVNTSSADIGISILNYSVTLVENITVKNNRVSGSVNAIRISGKNNSLNVKNIFIQDNELLNSPTSHGINVQTVTLSDLTVTGNTITGNGYAGIRFSSSSAILAGKFLINNNDILDNFYGLLNDTGYEVNAQRNYWGYPSGPYDPWTDATKPTINPQGEGNAVYGAIDYRNWIGSEDFEMNVEVDAHEVDGIYYVQSGEDKYLNFKVSSPTGLYGQRISASLWEYDGNGSRTGNRYIGSFSYDANSLPPNGEIPIDWEMLITTYMGGLRGQPVPEGDYLLWVERYWDAPGGGYVRGSNTRTRITVDNTHPTIGEATMYVNGVESRLAKSGDTVEITTEVTDPAGVDKIKLWFRSFAPTRDLLKTGYMNHEGDNLYSFEFVVPEEYENGTDLNEDINGNYFTFRTYDSLGNYGYRGGANRFTIDNTAPSAPTGITIYDHEDNELGCNGYTNNRNIRIDWDDNIEGDFSYYLFDLKDKDGHKTLTESEYNAHIRDIDGEYRYKIRTVDLAGNISEPSAWCHVTLDREAPSTPTNLHFTTLEGEELGCSNYTSQYDIIARWDESQDNTGVAHYEYRSFNPPDGWKWGTPKVGTNYRRGAFTQGEGTYGFKVRAIDLAGNPSAWTATDLDTSCQITYDTTPPVVTITTPSDGDYIRGTLDLIGDIDELDLWRYFYMVKNVSTGINVTSRTVYADSLENETFYTWDTTQSDDGEYLLHLAARDLADNRKANSEDNIRVIVDNEAPQGTIDYLFYPSNNEIQHFTTNDNTPVLGGTCSDNIALDTVVLEIDEQTQTITCDNDTWRSNAFNELDDGTYLATLTLTDLAGNETVVTETITIDTVAPTAEHTYYKNGIEITDPIAYVQGVDELTFTGEYWDDDPSSGLYKDVFVIFRNSDLKAYCGWRQFLTGGVLLNGTNYQNLETHQSLTNCVASLDDGAYHIRHRIYDSATRSTAPTFNQHRQYVTLPFVVDTTEPQTTLDDISDTHHKTLPIDISGNSTDDNGIAEVRVYGSDSGEDNWDHLGTEIPDVSGNWTYLATPPAEGVYDIKIEVEDLAGNIEELFMTNITYDETAPDSTITSPEDGYITNDTPVIEGETTDDFSVDYVTLSYTTYDQEAEVCGEEWTEFATLNNTEGDLPFNWSYDGWDLENGIYCIKAQGTDLAENEEETSIVKNITYDTSDPKVLLSLIAGLLNVTAEDLFSGIDNIEVRIGADGKWIDYEEGMNLNELVGGQPGTYTIYVRVTDKAGNTTTESTTFTIPSPPPTTAEEVLGAIIAPFTPQPAQALGTGGYLYAQTTTGEGTEDEEEEETNDTEVEEDTGDTEEEEDKEVKGTEDENGEEETEGRPWWIYPLIILPLLLLFFILWKRRKEDEEKPQY